MIFFHSNYSVKLGILYCTILLLSVSCNTGNKVVSSFGKRKYTKGYYSFLQPKLKEPKVGKLNSIASLPEKKKDGQKKEVKDDGKGAITLINYIVPELRNNKKIIFKNVANAISLSFQSSGLKHKISDYAGVFKRTINKSPAFNSRCSLDSNRLVGENNTLKTDNSGNLVWGFFLIILGIVGILLTGFFLLLGIGINPNSPLVIVFALLLLLSLIIFIYGIVKVAS